MLVGILVAGSQSQCSAAVRCISSFSAVWACVVHANDWCKKAFVESIAILTGKQMYEMIWLQMQSQNDKPYAMQILVKLFRNCQQIHTEDAWFSVQHKAVAPSLSTHKPFKLMRFREKENCNETFCIIVAAKCHLQALKCLEDKFRWRCWTHTPRHWTSKIINFKTIKRYAAQEKLDDDFVSDTLFSTRCRRTIRLLCTRFYCASSKLFGANIIDHPFYRAISRICVICPKLFRSHQQRALSHTHTQYAIT